MIDHKDGNKLNNSLTNLRWVNNNENGINQFNAKGYFWDTNKNKWHAQIKVNGKQIYIGIFDNEIDARQSYVDARKKYYPRIF